MSAGEPVALAVGPSKSFRTHKAARGLAWACMALLAGVGALGLFMPGWPWWVTPLAGVAYVSVVVRVVAVRDFL